VIIMEVIEPKFLDSTFFPWEPLNIIPLGDIQYSGAEGPTDLNGLRKTIKMGTENNAWYLSMGDMIDFVSPSNRQRLKQASLYDTATSVIDDAVTKLEDELLEILAPTKGRWLCHIEGHHFYEHLNGLTTGQRFAEILGGPYAGDSAMLRLTFRNELENSTSESAMIKLFAHHGHGSSSTVVGPLPKLERLMAYFGAHVFFIGHFHKQSVIPMPFLDLTDRGTPHLLQIPRAIVCTGSYLKGWEEGSTIGGRPSGSYVEQKLLPPVSLGSPMVTLFPERVVVGKKISQRRVDIRGMVQSV